MFIIIPLSLSHFLFALLFPLSLTKSFLLSIYTLSCITHRPVFSIVFWVCPSKPRIDLKRKRAKWYNILSTFFFFHHTFHYCFSLWQNIESSLVTKNLFVIYEGGVSLVHLLSAHLVSMIRHSFIIILLYSKHFFFRLVGCLLAILRCSRYIRFHILCWLWMFRTIQFWASQLVSKHLATQTKFAFLVLFRIPFIDSCCIYIYRTVKEREHKSC